MALIASSFGLKKEVIKGTCSWWLKKGFNLSRVSGVTYKKDLLCSSNLESRVLELKKAFQKSTPGEVVWSLRGGYGLQEILPYLKESDFKTKKTYMGFSDGTALHYLLNKNLGIASVHSPHANAAFQKFNKDKINSKINVLLNNPHKFSEVFKGLRLLNSSVKKSVQAEIVGGNLTTLLSLVGTKYDKGCAGNILFLEEVEEPAYKVNRMLTHLDQAGFLKGVRAVVFGHFSHSNKAQEKLVRQILKRWALKQKFPVVSGMEAGHVHHKNNPFWLGKKSKLILDDQPSLLNNI
ncbi:MAG: LD-carboxypeptidase [Bdellovibrionales bacterium]